ncbi:MAG: metallophosphoesterase family protein [Bacteroidales bacterium]|jgi:putative phosphoesterase|nr:metallophosphoesterase family protein [Bacteroidales bacterium]
MRIGVLSDTHGWVDPVVYEHFADVDEVWHAGDAGNIDVITELESFRPLRAVWGNVDDFRVRRATKEYRFFKAGNKNVLIIHIGGYPGHYSQRALELIRELKPDIFVCGHSHIVKVIFDRTHNMLCINPGAAGRTGIHKVMTLLRFTVEGDNVSDMEVIEFGTRGRTNDH